MIPIARVDGALGDSNSKKYWITTDHINNYRVITDIQGKPVWQSDYTPFGSQFGKSSDPDFEEWNGFTGKESDPDPGLMYFNARWYDADTGRFISEDPAMDPNNPNLYSYCANNPLNSIDPNGLMASKPYEGDPWEFEDPTSGGGTAGSGTSGNGSTYTSPWVPTMPDFQAPDAWDQYQNYWKNFPTGYEWDRELCNQAIMVLNSGMDLWGFQALNPNNVDLRSTINLRDWNITNGQALSVIKNVVHVTVDAMQRSEKGFVELPFNTEKNANGYKSYEIMGLKYSQYGDMKNTFYWGQPGFVEELMVFALYWNYQHENSYIAFNVLSYRNGGPMATHKSHLNGDDVDLKIYWNGKDVTNIMRKAGCKSGDKYCPVYMNKDPDYKSFDRPIIRSFINMVNSIYPGELNNFVWGDPVICSSVRGKSTPSLEYLRWQHSMDR